MTETRAGGAGVGPAGTTWTQADMILNGIGTKHKPNKKIGHEKYKDELIPGLIER